LTATSDHAPVSDGGFSVGASIRRYRVAEGLTLAELARRSGVSIATISKIENGKITGGFETIYKIARGLGVLVTEIIDGEAEAREPMVVHRGSRSDVHPTGLYDYYPQAVRHAGALNSYLMVIHTRTVPEQIDWSIHNGEEVIIVLEGAIVLHQEGAPPQRLDAGDSACFDCRRRHCFVNAASGLARIVSVSTRGPAMRGHVRSAPRRRKG
jgi:transcriptional regulator with XRE-family HTH domain